MNTVPRAVGIVGRFFCGRKFCGLQLQVGCGSHNVVLSTDPDSWIEIRGDADLSRCETSFRNLTLVMPIRIRIRRRRIQIRDPRPTSSFRRNVTETNGSFRSVPLDVTVGCFRKNCSYPFRPKIDFPAERFKLLTICSVPSE
uniref:Uncharacterized protein n=1 Tax=Romanomermis culicivorax TaxID=13658 RepID=A0A915IG45_ROMCU